MAERARTPPAFVRILSPLADFLATESAGGVLLALGAVAALVWANSPWSASYERLWTTSVALTFGHHHLALDLRHWVNDGLMTIFFFVVGLEIKRELTDGHLSTRRTALLPLVAAVGGMAVPALVYLAVAGGEAGRGWAIPMATDIALAVGVVAVVGSHVPSSMRAFLLGLAIVDDVGGIVVIATVYTDRVAWWWLVSAGGAFVAAVAARRLRLQYATLYLMLGALMWLALHEAGIHATLAGVAMGLLAPATPRLVREAVDVDRLADLSSIEAAIDTTSLARQSISVVEWWQHVLHPWTSYVIVPVFALANTGIEISGRSLADAFGSRITWGVALGLVVGKPLGIVVASGVAIRAGVVDPPSGATRRQLVGVGTAAGIGFTIAVFITELAFTDPTHAADAKIGILAASITAALVAGALLLRRPRRGDRGYPGAGHGER